MKKLYITKDEKIEMRVAGNVLWIDDNNLEYLNILTEEFQELSQAFLIDKFTDDVEQSLVKLSHKQERNVILNRADDLPDIVKKEIIAELLKGLNTD